MKVIIGSARHDERGRYTNGAKGDNIQTISPDYKGEVSMQNFYVHYKGWYVIRPKDPTTAGRIAQKMKAACNNKNLGYSQSDRYGVIRDGIDTKYPSNCDCSSLVRACVKEATGKDPGDFTTASAAARLEATGLFMDKFPYLSESELLTGDILCTKTKGHIVIVTDGNNPDTQPKTGNPYKEPTKNVKFNSHGNDARWLQYMLNLYGYCLIVDGAAGEKTISALKDFQSSHDLVADGICGPLTREKLRSSL